MTERAMSPSSIGEVFDVGRLRDFVVAAFAAAGATSEDADTAAEVLVSTEARGVWSHGVQTLPIHLDNLLHGGTRSPTTLEIVRENAVTATVDGKAGIGLVVATRANELALAKARTSGLGLVLVRNSNHFGAAGHYALLTAAAGFIGIATSNASPIMTAPGSRTKVISNGPLAYAVPTGAEPVCLDIAMSATAGMKVRRAAANGEAIPLGWVVDSTGKPTTDPAAYANGGALMPVGGHKGYGLSLLTETLAGALSGAAMTRQVVPWLVDTATPTNAGHAFWAIDVESFMDRAEFYSRMRALVAELRAAEPAEPDGTVLVPGDLEWRRERDAARTGLRLHPGVEGRLEQVAEKFGLQDTLAAARSHP